MEMQKRQLSIERLMLTILYRRSSEKEHSLSMRDAEKEAEDNPFSYNAFVKGRTLPPVDLFADPVVSTPPPPPRAAAAASRTPPVDLFAPPPPLVLPPPAPTPVPPPPLTSNAAPPDKPAKSKKEDEENPFAFHNWVKQQNAPMPAPAPLSVSGGASGSTNSPSSEDLMRRLREAETRAADAHRAMKAMKEKEAKEAAALEAVVQAVERNLAQATQRAEKAEKKLAKVQAELDRRKMVSGTAEERARMEILESQLAAAQARNAQLAAQINVLAEGATKEAQALEAGSSALKQLAQQLLAADKIGPIP